MPFHIIRNDITLVQADAIVNPANPEPTYAGGTDYAIYTAAGAAQVLAARQAIGKIAPGQVAVTPAFALQAKHIIHTVGPVWEGGTAHEYDVLRACYVNALAAAADLKCESIAFPLLATGVNGFPKDKALQIALSAISTFLMDHEMDVTLAVFSRAAFELSGKVFNDVSALIDEVQVRQTIRREYEGGYALQGRMDRLRRYNPEPEEELTDAQPSVRFTNLPQAMTPKPAQAAAPMAAPPMAVCAAGDGEEDERIVGELLKHRSETFQERLLHLIDDSGMDDVAVYKRANIDRKHFSKIRSNRDYQPKKKTALAFAVALRLDLAQTEDLLARAGWALSDSRKFDVIVMYFIREKRYDMSDINATLFAFNQEELGA